MTTPEVTERRLELDGFSLWLREAGIGAGPPVVCLHGGPGMDGGYFFPDAGVWGPGLRALARDHHVIAYDQRGCGRSGAPEDVEQPLALSRHVEDLERVRKALDLGPVAVLGHSFGSVLAILHALEHVESVTHLVIVGGAPTREFKEGYRRSVAEELDAEDRERLAEIEAEPPSDEAMHERFAIALPLYFHRDLDERERTSLLESVSFSAEVNRALAAGIEEYDLGPALGHLRAPSLVIYGESDRVVRPEHPLAFRGKLPGGRFVAFAESGHFPFLEEPEPFARVVHYFLRHGHRRAGEEAPAGGAG
ncbi:MAG: alpha/beta fold hydrolase [Gemmatimonadota bacterium]|nr:alpha/beta fold hydrolase [Gemmatimonadota bacterium]